MQKTMAKGVLLHSIVWSLWSLHRRCETTTRLLRYELSFSFACDADLLENERV